MNHEQPLLRKKDLVDKLGINRSTLTDWINEFNVYIPTTKHKNVTYYGPQTLQVLETIQYYREKGYAKPQIMAMLGEKGFAINVNDAVDDALRVSDGGSVSDHDGWMTVMKTMGQMAVEMKRQQDVIKEQKILIEQFDHNQQQFQQEMIQMKESITKIKEDETIQQLKNVVYELQQELAEEKARPWYKKLFSSTKRT
ncbi:MerR family transcriptional regulator [Bacillus sp. JJ722]|uniref:MerR family transcriptional regulator n=1 Tax=Bacillus sp. JJ722 TaxID=3122973 RepID=UPI002FFD6C37